MKTQFALVIAVLVVALSDICISENLCDVTKVKACYEEVTHFYEGLGFPLYGQDDVELDETCTNINVSYECIHNYADECKDHPDCNENCKEVILEIGNFSITGLYKLQTELCDPDSAMRRNYLDNYVCLEENSKKYDMCHNDSLKSQNYMGSISDQKKLLEVQCCYFSWFQDCFKKATEPCSGAMEYVTFGLYSLIGQGEEVLCENTPMKCDTAPLPTNEEPGDHSDEDESNKPDKHIGEPTKEPTKVHKKNASNQLLPTCQVVISIMCMFFSKRLF